MGGCNLRDCRIVFNCKLCDMYMMCILSNSGKFLYFEEESV